MASPQLHQHRRIPEAANLDFLQPVPGSSPVGLDINVAAAVAAGLTTRLHRQPGRQRESSIRRWWSPGYPNGTDGTNPTWLQAAFFDILGRAPDAAAQSGFLGELAAGASRTAVALQMLTSTEYRTRFVQNAYQTYLNRPADSGGLNFLVSSMANGATDEMVVATLVSSAEFYAASGGSNVTHPQQNDKWVHSLYLTLVQRPSDPGGQAFFLGQLDAADSAARTGVALTIANSTEYLTLLIQSTYQSQAYLGRQAGPATWPSG